MVNNEQKKQFQSVFHAGVFFSSLSPEEKECHGKWWEKQNDKNVMNGWYDNQNMHSVSCYGHKLSIITHQWEMQPGMVFSRAQFSILYFLFVFRLSVRFVVWSKRGYSTIAIIAKASLNPQIRFNQIKFVVQYASGVYSTFNSFIGSHFVCLSSSCSCVFVFHCWFFFYYSSLDFNDFVLNPFGRFLRQFPFR